MVIGNVFVGSSPTWRVFKNISCIRFVLGAIYMHETQSVYVHLLAKKN